MKKKKRRMIHAQLSNTLETLNNLEVYKYPVTDEQGASAHALCQIIGSVRIINNNIDTLKRAIDNLIYIVDELV